MGILIVMILMLNISPGQPPAPQTLPVWELRELLPHLRHHQTQGQVPSQIPDRQIVVSYCTVIYTVHYNIIQFLTQFIVILYSSHSTWLFITLLAILLSSLLHSHYSGYYLHVSERVTDSPELRMSPDQDMNMTTQPLPMPSFVVINVKPDLLLVWLMMILWHQILTRNGGRQPREWSCHQECQER